MGAGDRRVQRLPDSLLRGIENRLRRNPERLAWTILLISFAICVGLAVGVPLGIRWLIINLTTPLQAVADVARNDVQVQSPFGQIRTIQAATTPGDGEVREGDVLRLSENAEAVLTVSDPRAGTTLCQIVLYPNSQLGLITLRAPRFSQSPNAYRLELRLESGRARINATFPLTRPVEATIFTPQAEVVLTEPGSYALEVGQGETQVAVIDGWARVEAQGQSVVLRQEQRTQVQANEPPPPQPLPAARNLIRDGNFTTPVLNSAWISYTQALKPPPGTAEVVNLGGRNVLRFRRQGEDHAETGIIQNIGNGDVRGFSTLRLHLLLQVLFQDVPVCGTLGSECPIMVELRYKDEQGTDRSWFQGFYYLDGPDPKYCVQCGGIQDDHRRVLQNVAVPYDSDNLMEVLTRNGLPKPARVLWLRIYASGHSFDAAVSEVELLAQE